MMVLVDSNGAQFQPEARFLAPFKATPNGTSKVGTFV
jgi:hypothetical protein